MGVSVKNQHWGTERTTVSEKLSNTIGIQRCSGSHVGSSNYGLVLWVVRLQQHPEITLVPYQTTSLDLKPKDRVWTAMNKHIFHNCYGSQATVVSTVLNLNPRSPYRQHLTAEMVATMPWQLKSTRDSAGWGVKVRGRGYIIYWSNQFDQLFIFPIGKLMYSVIQ